MKVSIATLLFLIAFTVPCISGAQSLADTPTFEKQLAELQKMLAGLKTPKPQVGVTTANTTSEWQYDRPDEQQHEEPEVVKARDKALFFKVRESKLIPYETKRVKSANEPRTKKVWNAFRTVAGQTFLDKHVDEFIAFDSKNNGTLGFVMFMPDKEPTWLTSENEGDGWGVALNISPANMEDPTARREFFATLIHEYAHLLTINSEQVDYKTNSPGDCKMKDGKYFLLVGRARDRGCALKSSYLQLFVDQFWTEKEIKKADASWKSEDNDTYYKDNADKFVTWYAARNPAEDLAESFTDFIIMRKPTGNKVEDQKILFFYKYPELVQIRTDMRARIASHMR